MSANETARRPQTAIFYSTLRYWVWGAPDYVWPVAAERLLEHGVRVIATLQPAAFERPEVKDLARRGAIFVSQVPLPVRHGRLARWRRLQARMWGAERRLRQLLGNAPAPHVFVNQGGTYDIVDEEFLHPWLGGTATYDLFCHSNRHGPPLAADRRAKALTFFRGARRCFFNSEWTRDLTEKQLLQRFSNATLFHYRVRFPYTRPLPWPAGDTVRFASVSRYETYHKGLDVLLHAIARLPVDLPAWSFDFFGRGEELEYLEGLHRFLGLDDRVRFHPFAQDVSTVWRDRHVLVLPSRYEGLSVAMLEAMACARPVLRTPYGGCAEWIVAGETGFICPAPEPDLLAESLAACLRARADLPRLGANAFQRLSTQLPRDPERVYLEPFGIE